MWRARVADDDELADVEAHDEAPDPVVLLLGVLAELGHLAEHGDRAAPAGRVICASVLSAAATESGLAL